ncbi:MAG: pyrroline-5-carboxylate reductase [Campylobacter sp.]|nr:pyrroline-5-carboxylate reductase [Campylobacter sp.]
MKFKGFLMMAAAILAQNLSGGILEAVAISKPTAWGQKVDAVELRYSDLPSAVEVKNFSVYGRKILNADIAPSLAFDGEKAVILKLDINDENADVTYQKARREPSVERDFSVIDVSQNDELKGQNGKVIEKSNVKISRLKHLLADDFKQLEFTAKNGTKIVYNLFIPKNYDKNQKYPLVMFIHDAGSTNTNPKNTLYQGNGATTWASDEWQAKHASFVLAPQFDHKIVNDSSDDPADLPAIYELLQALSGEYNIDTNRLYTTGQSGGAMMSIALNIAYPKLFAASFIVAGQWDAQKCIPMAKTRQFILVSNDDAKAFPGQNAITGELEKNGAKIARATLNDGSDINAMNAEIATLLSNNANIYYAVIKSGTLPDQKSDPSSRGAAHMGTWKVAYELSGVKEWLFSQVKK